MEKVRALSTRLGVGEDRLHRRQLQMLRGDQTPGELKQRTERMAPLPTLAEVERVLGELGQLGYATRLERRPGQKEDRYAQLLGGAGDEMISQLIATQTNEQLNWGLAGALSAYAPIAFKIPLARPSALAPGPLTASAPAVGRIRPSIIRSEVVLPAPFGPRYPKTSPASTVRSTLSTAVNSP